MNEYKVHNKSKTYIVSEQKCDLHSQQSCVANTTIPEINQHVSTTKYLSQLEIINFDPNPNNDDEANEDFNVESDESANSLYERDRV
jgi:hypothetical protein